MHSSFPLHSASDADAIIENVLQTYRRHGHEAYHGEAVTQLEHALQAAELARRERPQDPEFVLAAFLHDYGHLCADAETAQTMEGYGFAQHEILGAEQLRSRHFSEKIARLVAGHVEAKRYLVASDPAYADLLSEASRFTLEKQGGPMSAEAAAAFRNDPLFELHLHLRRLDEQAKAPGLSLSGTLSWLELLMRKHLLAQL